MLSSYISLINELKTCYHDAFHVQDIYDEATDCGLKINLCDEVKTAIKILMSTDRCRFASAISLYYKMHSSAMPEIEEFYGPDSKSYQHYLESTRNALIKLFVVASIIHSSSSFNVPVACFDIDVVLKKEIKVQSKYGIRIVIQPDCYLPTVIIINVSNSDKSICEEAFDSFKDLLALFNSIYLSEKIVNLKENSPTDDKSVSVNEKFYSWVFGAITSIPFTFFSGLIKLLAIKEYKSRGSFGHLTVSEIMHDLHIHPDELKIPPVKENEFKQLRKLDQLNDVLHQPCINADEPKIPLVKKDEFLYPSSCIELNLDERSFCQLNASLPSAHFMKDVNSKLDLKNHPLANPVVFSYAFSYSSEKRLIPTAVNTVNKFYLYTVIVQKLVTIKDFTTNQDLITKLQRVIKNLDIYLSSIGINSNEIANLIDADEKVNEALSYGLRIFSLSPEKVYITSNHKLASKLIHERSFKPRLVDKNYNEKSNILWRCGNQLQTLSQWRKDNGITVDQSTNIKSEDSVPSADAVINLPVLSESFCFESAECFSENSLTLNH